MANKKSLSYPVLFMAIITVVMIFILAFINQITYAKVEENQNLEFQKKILYVFDLYEEGMEDDEIQNIFNNEISSDPNMEGVYTLEQDSDVTAYAVPFDGPGLWGSINGYVGIDGQLENIVGVEFIEQSETPGLGGRISEEPYKSQYRGIEIGEGDSLLVNRPAPGGNIDAIAGATQTSTFVVDMINEDLNQFIDEMGGNK